jgi:hypothetical protein
MDQIISVHQLVGDALVWDDFITDEPDEDASGDDDAQE